jgi:hypothetical protein
MTLTGPVMHFMPAGRFQVPARKIRTGIRNPNPKHIPVIAPIDKPNLSFTRRFTSRIWITGARNKMMTISIREAISS